MTITTTNNKRVDPDDADADVDAVKEPAAKKRAIDNIIINVDDDDVDDVDVDESPATATTATTTTIVPVIPLLDPTDPSYDLAANANKGPDMNNKVLWVIYMAVEEPNDSRFASCLNKCRKIAAGISDEYSDRLQLDGTRHVTLWCGKLTKDEAREIRFEEDDDLLPVDVTIDGWVEKGAYLKLDDTTQTKLRTIMGKIQNLPGGGRKKTKNACDHMSLYRARRMYYKTFQNASTQIREGVPANNNEWGSIPGVTIRLKVQGSDYNHCKVLVCK